MLTIRFYEERGLVEPLRTGGNQRRFLRADIRRVSFILIAQKLGLSLAEIGEAMAALPHERTPNAKDWEKISRAVKGRIDAEIARLNKLRADLDGCIGCGCLSLKRCGSTTPTIAGVRAAQGPGYCGENSPQISRAAIPLPG